MALNPDLQKAIDAITKNAPFYSSADKYFEGTAPEKFASNVFARLLMGSANRYRMNYARVPVVALTNRVKIASFGVVGDNADTDFLQTVWDANQMVNVQKEVHDKTASSGSSYLLAWPDPDDETGKTIDVSLCDPAQTRMFYSLENSRKQLFAARMWAEGKSTRVNLYYADRIEKYVTKKGAAGKQATGYAQYYDLFDDTEVDPQVDLGKPQTGTASKLIPIWPIPNPFNRIPIFHFRDSSDYGRPVNRDAWEPQDGINKLTSTMMATVDYQGFPQRYIIENPVSPEEDTLDELDDDGTVIDGDLDFPDDGFGNDAATNQKKSLKAGPAGLWFLQNAKSVGQFAAADSNVFLNPLLQYVKSISTNTQTPLHAFQGMGDTPSGESLRAANAPLITNVQSFEEWVKPTWTDFMEFLLQLGDIEAEVTMVWANPDKADDAEYWTGVVTKISAGVPVWQALEEAGYTPDQIEEWGMDQKSVEARNNATAAASAAAAQPAAPAATPEVDPDMAKIAKINEQADAFAVLTKGGYTDEAAAKIVGLPYDADSFDKVDVPVIPDTDVAATDPNDPAAPAPNGAVDNLDATGKPIPGITPPALVPAVAATKAAATATPSAVPAATPAK